MGSDLDGWPRVIAHPGPPGPNLTKVLPWLRHTDTFAEYSLSDGNAFCGKVSVPPAI